MSSSLACVTFQKVSKRYGDTTVLQDITLEFPAGVTSAIVGASGSGKTTLLRLINALEKVDAGQLEVNGEPIPSDLTAVLDNVTLVAKLDGLAPEECEARAATLLKQMNLQETLWPRYPGQLSGGQQQRVGLCRAQMLEPALLLLDEPFSAVDPITRLELHDHFIALNAQNTSSATIIVTHDVREARKLADHLVILAAGEVLQAGPVEDVIRSPATDYVSRLLTEQLS